MPLPPDALFVLLVPSRKKIVSVHPDVHERVQEGHKHHLASPNKPGQSPAEHDHGAVMVHVQERDLPLLLFQDEEELEPTIKHYYYN